MYSLNKYNFKTQADSTTTEKKATSNKKCVKQVLR